MVGLQKEEARTHVGRLPPGLTRLNQSHAGLTRTRDATLCPEPAAEEGGSALRSCPQEHGGVRPAPGPAPLT